MTAHDIVMVLLLLPASEAEILYVNVFQLGVRELCLRCPSVE
jgi:hypothetical protein